MDSSREQIKYDCKIGAAPMFQLEFVSSSNLRSPLGIFDPPDRVRVAKPGPLSLNDSVLHLCTKCAVDRRKKAEKAGKPRPHDLPKTQ